MPNTTRYPVHPYNLVLDALTDGQHVTKYPCDVFVDWSDSDDRVPTVLEETRIPSGIWSRLYGWTVQGLYKSYTGLKARVESHSANHRPNRLGHVGAHDGL